MASSDCRNLEFRPVYAKSFTGIDLQKEHRSKVESPDKHENRIAGGLKLEKTSERVAEQGETFNVARDECVTDEADKARLEDQRNAEVNH